MAPLGIEVYTGNWQSLTGKRQTKQKGEVKRVVLNPCLRKSDQSYARGSPQRSKIQPKELAGSSPGTMYVVFILRESYS